MRGPAAARNSNQYRVSRSKKPGRDPWQVIAQPGFQLSERLHNVTQILAAPSKRKTGFPPRQTPERFRRVLVADKAISPELAADITIRQFGRLVSEVPA